MSTDSKTDLNKYLPSVEASLAASDEEAAQERLRKAVDGPLPDKPSAGRKAASAPAAKPARARAIAISAALRRLGRARRPSARAVLLAVFVPFVPAILVFVLFVKPQQKAGGGATAEPPASSGAERAPGAGISAVGSALMAPRPPESAVPVEPASSAISSAAPSARPKGGTMRNPIPSKASATPSAPAGVPIVKPIIIN